MNLIELAFKLAVNDISALKGVTVITDVTNGWTDRRKIGKCGIHVDL
jgi:hypothetical protein